MSGPQPQSRPDNRPSPPGKRERPPNERRPTRILIRAGLVLLVLLAVGALWVAADWWICLPEGAMESAGYVGRGECARCHEEEVKLWTGSDHDLAIDYATPETVLGDFDDCEFAHIAIDDVAKLTDADLQTVIGQVDLRQWALALHDVADEARRTILRNFPESDRGRLLEATNALQAVRPCDVTDAHREIGDAMRRLKREGKITVDFALTSKTSRRGDEFFVTTDNPEGELETFPVKYVFGYRPLQQYLVEFPDGRVQCLPIAWDTETRAWYHLYPKEPIPHDDPLHWTGPLQNWNYMCAECHSTNLRKNYRLADNTYHTTFSEIDVSCETCHGPGSLHCELADGGGLFWDRRYRFGLPNLKDPDSRVEIETCAPCHSRRRIVYPGMCPGGKFLDHYLPEVLDNNLYYADGQVLEEDYVYSSFIQSLMYSKGIRCTNCHDPHTMRVKSLDPDGPWDQVPNNRLCGQSGCHLPAKYDAVTHHHHPDATKPGTRCVECHMPETKYMVVDPRRDHSLRVPRPDLTVSLNIPNACNVNGCHDPAQGETAEWATEQCETWYGKPKGPPHFAHAIAAGRAGRPEGERALAEVVRRKDHRAIVRASAISLLSRYASGEAQFRASEGLNDPDELVRAVSVRSLQNFPPADTHQRLAPMLHDPVRAVRTEAARLLSAVPRRAFSKEDARAFDAALAEYMEAQEDLADQPAAHLNMAVVYANLGDAGKAEQAYQTAIRLDADFVPARINLAMLCDQLGQKDEAEKQFRRVIELEPELAEAHYSLGLLLAENEARLDEASVLLATAAKLAPENPRIHYNYGLALQKLGRADEAEKQLATAHKLSPGATEFLHALTILYAQQQQWSRARQCADKLLGLEPANPQWRSLGEFIERELR
ncbi:MAG TPA: tetratricopeptide repeat protein [Thermoguttaceae bacterium]|nr:tetratricopeptide repeat protein [Thermoguttaceae bacterium]